jgi:hypothetical protein
VVHPEKETENWAHQRQTGQDEAGLRQTGSAWEKEAQGDRKDAGSD